MVQGASQSVASVTCLLACVRVSTDDAAAASGLLAELPLLLLHHNFIHASVRVCSYIRLTVTIDANYLLKKKILYVL